jgi:hypothetical protein
MSGHHGHVLKMALSSLFANWTVMRMVFHQPLDDQGSKVRCVLSFDRDAHAVTHIGHAGHLQSAAFIFWVHVLDYGALSACTNRTKGRMPTKVGQIKAFR